MPIKDKTASNAYMREYMKKRYNNNKKVNSDDETILSEITEQSTNDNTIISIQYEELKTKYNDLENKYENLQKKFSNYKDNIINKLFEVKNNIQEQQPIIIQQPAPIKTVKGSYNKKLKTENILLEEPTEIIEEIKQPKEKAVKLSKKEKDELELEQLKMPITFEEFYDYIEIFESDFEIDGICYNDGNRRNYYKNILKRAVESVNETLQDLPIQATNLRNKIFYVRTDKLKQKEQYINDKNKWIYSTKDNLLRIEMLHSKITEKLNLLRVKKMMECNENDNSDDEDDDNGNVLKLNGTVAGEAMKYKTDYLKDSDDLYGFCNLILPLFKMEGIDI